MILETYLPSIETLVELRKRLIFLAVAIVVGMGIAWNFPSHMLTFIEKPLTGQTYLTELKKTSTTESGRDTRQFTPDSTWRKTR